MAAGGTTPLPDAPTKGAWSTDKLLPLTRLRTLDVDADLAFGQLTLSKLPIQNAALKASGLDGQLKLDTLSGGLYNGSFQANGTLDLPQEWKNAFERAYHILQYSPLKKLVATY